LRECSRRLFLVLKEVEDDKEGAVEVVDNELADDDVEDEDEDEDEDEEQEEATVATASAAALATAPLPFSATGSSRPPAPFSPRMLPPPGEAN
jgi:hypothetical protein